MNYKYDRVMHGIFCHNVMFLASSLFLSTNLEMRELLLEQTNASPKESKKNTAPTLDATTCDVMLKMMAEHDMRQLQRVLLAVLQVGTY